MKHGFIRALAMALCVLLAPFVMPFSTVRAGSTVVRVGYFAFEGYHQLADDGTRSGYGYDYLQEMANYNDWTYEYVGYDKSWSDMQTMLLNGEIDILTSAQKTPARMESFDFSESPIGTSYTLLTVRSGDSRYLVDDYTQLNGIRVGMIRNNSRNDSFAEFARQYGFSYTPVYYDNISVMSEALQNGDAIDGIVTSSLRNISSEWVVATFDPSPFYVMVRKGNSALLAQINYAIDQLQMNLPDLASTLQSRYYNTTNIDEIAFSTTDRQFIAAAQGSGKVYQVLICPDRKPVSYFENGKWDGILPRLLDLIMTRAGLQYEIVPVQTQNDYTTMVSANDGYIVMDLPEFKSDAEDLGYKLTASYWSTTLSRIFLKGHGADEISTAGVVNNFLIATNALDQHFPSAAVTNFDTLDSCIAAVTSGEMDTALMFTDVAQLAVSLDERNRTVYSVLPDLTVSFCMGVSQNEDYRIMSVLNKAISTIATNDVSNIVNAETDYTTGDLTLTRLLYTHPYLVALILITICVLITIVLLLVMRSRSAHLEMIRSHEFERFITYVCRINDEVAEYDLQSREAWKYEVHDGKVERIPLPGIPKDFSFIHPDHREEVEKIFSIDSLTDIITRGDTRYAVVRATDGDGVFHWFEYVILGITPDELHPRNFMLFKHNMDEIKLREERQKDMLTDALRRAESASEAKGSFMSRMSHEIRTPLNAVIGYLDIADDEDGTPPKVSDCIAKSRIAARNLLAIINDVLDISSIESGRMKIASDTFDLKRLIGSLTTLFYTQSHEKHVEFDVLVDTISEERVIGDELRVNQILTNLLSNAVKFTGVGGKVTLSISQLNLTDDKVHFKFMVSDTGIGMSPEYMSRIFKPFEQEQASTARKYGGTGLGLSICHNLVRMMGGTIEVNSTPGEGTTFTVLLAFDRTADQDTGEVATDSFAHLRVLVVDDEPETCTYVQKLLTRCGVKSESVLSGEKAIKKVQRRMNTDYQYDMCIIDWSMPGKDGLTTAREIRSICGDTLPIIIATAYDYSAIVDEAKAVGVNRIISKPLFQSSMFNLLVNTYGKYKPVERADKPQHEDFSGIHVLLAEDNEMNMEIALDILKKASLTVTPALNGKEALDIFCASADGEYQVILMDIQMPVMDGYEATRAIRASSHPQAKSIPIIAMTANAFTSDVTAALTAGMNDHIAKPINYQKLFESLHRLTGKA